MLVTKITDRAVDLGGVNELKRQLEKMIAEKDSQLAVARTKEESLDLRAAFEIYDRYAQAEDVRRVSRQLGQQEEDRGNFLTALEHYERAGQGEKAGKIRTQVDQQKAAYEKAGLLLLDGKVDEALAIYDRYKDEGLKSKALLDCGNKRAEEGLFDQALDFYRRAGSLRDVEWAQKEIGEREKTAKEAGQKEAAGDYEAAVQLFENCGAYPAMRRVAREYAKQLENSGDYVAAVHFFEIAEVPEDAKRLRTQHGITGKASWAGSVMEGDEIYEKNIGAVVTVVVETFMGSGHGSGFFVKRGGWVATNNHVVDGATSITVRLANKQEYRAEVVTCSKVPDFALLKIALPHHQIVKLGRTSEVKAGQAVVAIGTPQDEAYAGSITGGIVSNPNLVYDGNKVLQIDAAINHGNSGGPVFSKYGKVIGINTFGLGTHASKLGLAGVGSDVQNINFAIQIDEVAPIIDAHARR